MHQYLLLLLVEPELSGTWEGHDAGWWMVSPFIDVLRGAIVLQEAPHNVDPRPYGILSVRFSQPFSNIVMTRISGMVRLNTRTAYLAGAVVLPLQLSSISLVGS